MAEVMFKVGGTDYSQNVIAENYIVRSYDQFDAWTDANGREHRSVYRTQISGSFQMYFPTIEDFNSFCEDIRANKNNDTSVRCSVFDSEANQTETGDFFVDFAPTRYADAKWDDRVASIKITIKER